MRGTGKRLLALTLGILMVCMQIVTVFAAPVENCPGECIHLAAIGTTHYDTLAEAIEAAEEGSTVTVLADIADQQALFIEKSIILDLGGKTLSGQTTETDSLLHTTKNITVCNGTLSTDAGICLSVADCDLTVEETATITTEGATAIHMSGSGKLTVTGGTFQAKEHAIVLDIPKDGIMEASITGGNFTTEKETFLITKAEDATAPEGFVTGGTYNQNPSAYIPDFCGVIANNDGTYTVVSSFTLTFQANGGSGTMAPVTVNCGNSVKLPKCGFTAPKSMDFAGWKIGGKTYAAGDTYTPADNATATALWKAHVHSGGKATCGQKAVCKVCGVSYGKPASHKLTHIEAYAPTCSASGMTSHDKCITCGQRFADGVAISTRSVTIPALGHNWETVEAIPANCTEEGLLEHQKCTQCGLLRLKGETVKESALVIPAGEHVLETVLAVDATCKEAGTLAHERCTACGLLFMNGQEAEADALATPVISHVLSDWYNDETEHWKSCVDCSEVFRQKKHADPDADSICNDCGYTMTAPQQEVPNPEENESGFNWLFLIPIVAAVGIAVPLALKKRK